VPRITRALYGAAAFFGLLGVVLFFVLSTADSRAASAAPHSPEGQPLVENAVAALAPSRTAPSAESFALVVDSNMFSPTRTAPRVRFTVRPAEVDTAPSAPRAPAPPALRVYGITLRSTDSTALIDADPRVPGAETYRAGDTLPDGSLIVDITDSTVVIEGSRGRRVLRLETKTRPSRP
jgi:hypothetical protein